MKTSHRAPRRITKRVQPSSPRPSLTPKNSGKAPLSIKGEAEHSAKRGKNLTCILCCETMPVTKFSEEHVFPKEIGGKLILKDSVCLNCHSRYGDAADADVKACIRLENLNLEGAFRKR